MSDVDNDTKNAAPLKFFGADAGKPFAIFSNMYIAPIEMSMDQLVAHAKLRESIAAAAGKKKTPAEQTIVKFDSVEHAFQAAKALSASDFEKVRCAKTPKSARALGKKVELRPDWEESKETVMLNAVRCKFQTHCKCGDLLLSTGDRPLEEANPFDYVWGTGKTGRGQNKLGKILAQVRGELREAAKQKKPNNKTVVDGDKTSSKKAKKA